MCGSRPGWGEMAGQGSTLRSNDQHDVRHEDGLSGRLSSWSMRPHAMFELHLVIDVKC